ncbi:acyl carrier protein [Xenococcus sp. PCC 7305]|uniref:acyl carrier protein n=1 Tax=Xenococcus sp. PCC 7305 TaxID=102125 RepID=UPI0002ACC7B5|nr:acyl carrier protein [Xenococcus sp. PCC 7305]ELS05480.1 acyl carrier protein [Xenococcus sp. PCC 7305]
MSTTTSTELVAQLKTIIAEDLDVNLTVEEIDDNVSLFEEGLGFDSIAIVEFISAIEKHFDIEFDDSELDPENFKSLQVLADLIAGKVDA